MITIVETHQTYPNGIVRVETTSIVYDSNEAEIARGTHQKTLAPGDDFSAESATTKAICSAVHTADAIAAYQANAVV